VKEISCSFVRSSRSHVRRCIFHSDDVMRYGDTRRRGSVTRASWVGKTLIPSRLSVGSANTPSLTEKDTHGIFTARGVSWSCSRLMSSASETKRLSCIVPSAAASLILSSISRWMSSRVSLIVHARCVVRSVSRGLGGKNQKSLHPPILKKYTVRHTPLFVARGLGLHATTHTQR